MDDKRTIKEFTKGCKFAAIHLRKIKMKIFNYTGFVLIILAAIACEKDKVEPTYEIFGEWNWLKSYGGFTGHELQTPENTGISKTFAFLHNDSVIITKNTDTIQRTGYFLSREKSLLLHDTFDFVTINYENWISNTETLSLPMRYMIETLTDTLVLAEDVYDGYRHQFERKQ
jgi:hypothetical protein